MQGLGNDYIYVDLNPETAVNPPEVLELVRTHPAQLAKVVSNRHFGIGADGLILILPSKTAQFQMQIYNADGSEGEMCGNGIRCVGKYIFERELSSNRRLEIETKAGIKILELHGKGESVSAVTVDLGEPILHPTRIPVKSELEQIVGEPFAESGYAMPLTCVSMGNPHAIFFVDHITDDMVFRLGPAVESHSMFPNRTNVEFVEVLSPAQLRMRVWERGSGETMACGTGAAAVAVAAVLNGHAQRECIVHLLGGDLKLEWAQDNHVYQTGPAEFVFDGTIDISVD